MARYHVRIGSGNPDDPDFLDIFLFIIIVAMLLTLLTSLIKWVL